MHLTTALEELSEAELLDHADEVSRAQRECEVQVLRIALQVAVINNPDRLDPEVSKLPGRERTRRFGGVGTHDVTEFAASTLGARLGLSTGSAHSLMADALDLAIRLPQLWRRVEALEVRVGYARFVARRTRDLSIEQASYVDERVVESADGRIPWTRFEDLVTGAIVAADPAAAAKKEEENAKRQVANPTRSTEDGMRGFFIRAPFHVIAMFDARVQWFADILATLGDGVDTDDNDARRVKALAILSNPHQAVQLIEAFLSTQNTQNTQTSQTSQTSQPDDTAEPAEQPEVDWAKVMPTVTLFVHMYYGSNPANPTEPADGADRTGTVRVEGHGPVTEAWVREHLGPHAKFTIQPVFDLAGQAPVDAYEIPDRHRRAVHLMTPADIFPWGASTTTTAMQIDHTVPYRPMKDSGPPDPSKTDPSRTGQSRVGNYGPMTPFHHRLKTHHGWDVQQPFPGIYVWRDPHGAFYLVDHTGTRRIPTTSKPINKPINKQVTKRSPAEEALRRALFDLAA